MSEHTFVICAYGESQYLEECVLSCINQESVLKKDSIVIMYTSTPNEMIEKISKKYNVPLFTGQGGSIGKDWNSALNCVQTSFATIAHQDDLYLPEYGDNILKVFSKNKRLNLVFTDYFEIDNEGKKRERNINLRIKTIGLHIMSLLPFKWYQRRIYAFGNFISCPAVSFNLNRLKDFQFDEELRMVVDWDAWERIMRKSGRIQFVPQKLMAHRIHAESETTAATQDRTREQEEYMMYERYWGKVISKLFMKLYVLNQKANKT